MANFGEVFYQTFTSGFYFFPRFYVFNVFFKFLSERLLHLRSGLCAETQVLDRVVVVVVVAAAAAAAEYLYGATKNESHYAAG